MMEITNVKIWKSTLPSRKKARVEITIDDCFVIHDIRLMQKDEGDYYIAMPSRKNLKTGKFDDIAHPINAETRKKIQDVILEKYNSMEDEVEQPSTTEE